MTLILPRSPELLVATLREQLATQLNKTYQKERAAQKERISVERERASANPDLVKVPVVMVIGTGSGYEGAAAVLGASPILFK